MLQSARPLNLHKDIKANICLISSRQTLHQHMTDLISVNILDNKISHLCMLFSTVKAQLDKAAETLATIVTPKMSLPKRQLKIPKVALEIKQQ